MQWIVLDNSDRTILLPQEGKVIRFVVRPTKCPLAAMNRRIRSCPSLRMSMTAAVFRSFSMETDSFVMDQGALALSLRPKKNSA
jgi:hypothetical protein